MNKTKFFLAILVLFSTSLGVGCSPKPDVSLTTSITPNGGGTVSPTSGMFSNGVTETLIATPSQNYVFSGWAGDISGMTNPISLKMDSNKTVVATFSRINYSLTTSIGASGGGTITPASGNFAAGTTVTVTANPSQGYSFSKWDNSTSSSNVISILMDGNKTITAVFSKLFNLSSSISPQGAGTVKQNSSIYTDGTKATLTATSVFPYSFSGWTNADNNTANPTTVTMTSDKNVTANFILLNPGPTQTAIGKWSGKEIRVHFNLLAGQWVKGTYQCRALNVSVQDPAFATLLDLGYQTTVSFVFQAKTNGTYDFVMGAMDYVISSWDYSVTYNIYS